MINSKIEKPRELLQSVRDYLNTVMPPDEADKLFAVYKTYVYYQRDVHDKMSMWGRHTTPEEAIDYLTSCRTIGGRYLAMRMPIPFSGPP